MTTTQTERCGYCHGIGACPECWGRSAITALQAERDEAVALLRSFLVNPPEGKTFKQHVRGSAERFLTRLDGGAQ